MAAKATNYDPCIFHFTRPNLDKFTLKATLERSGTAVASGSSVIAGRDFLIVAVGD